MSAVANRLVANCSTAAEGGSSHCASSTATRTGCLAAKSCSTERKAKPMTC